MSSSDVTTSSVSIEPWHISAAGPFLAADMRELDAIFFQSSGTQSFADEAARVAFRQRWLGRYLNDDDLCFVARAVGDAQGKAASGGSTLDGGDRSAGRSPIVGYVIGALADPARDSRFDDIAYFQDLRHVTVRYPAHLHINCDAAWRSRGVGARLVAAFCDSARSKGAPGVHVVTGQGLRNTGFYARNGFVELAQALSNGKPVVFLARDLLARA